MKVVSLAISFILILLAGFAQTPPARLLSRFSFIQYTGGVIIVHAAMPGVADSLTFILDTGSGGISLDSATCSIYQIATTPTDTTINGIGGSRKVNFVFDRQLNLPGVSMQHLNFHVNDYSVLSSVYGEHIDGIIGYSFFSRYIVSINYDDQTISVYSPGEFKYPRNGSIIRPAFTNIPVKFAQVRDAVSLGYNFYIDTGGGLSLLLSDKLVKDSSLLSPKRKPLVTGAEGMLGRLQMRLTVVKSLTFGRYRFRNVPTFLYSDDYNVLNYPTTGGLIGSEILKRFNIVYNYPKKEMHLIPNKNFRTEFDYSYTGFSFYDEDGIILVEDVIFNSPAYKAGIRIGDQLISVGNNVSFNIREYKNDLQVANQKVKLLLRRNGDLFTTTIFTTSVLNR